MAGLALGVLVAGACSGDQEQAGVCAGVEMLATTLDDAATALGDPPDPATMAAAYRDMADGYDQVAAELVDDDAAAQTVRLARAFENAAEVLAEAEDAEGDEVEALLAEAEPMVALRAELAEGSALGLPDSAWEEIEPVCDVRFDDPADGPEPLAGAPIVDTSGGGVSTAADVRAGLCPTTGV